MNFVKHGCLLNEPTCINGIKVNVNEKRGVNVGLPQDLCSGC